MAVNHADLASVGTFGCVPLVAAYAAYDSGAGWWIFGAAALSLPGGFVLAYVVRKGAYFLLDLGMKRQDGWASGALFVGYLLVPFVASAGGLIGIWVLVRYAFVGST